MTEKQKDYILSLDKTLLDYAQYDTPKYLSKNFLGKDWVQRFHKIPHKDASNCINKLQEEAVRCGCYDYWYDDGDYF